MNGNRTTDRERNVPVDSPPATDWTSERPTEVQPELWAGTRPTEATLAGLDLPAGRTIGADGHVLGWEPLTGDPIDVSELWLRCAREFPNTGLWPICDSWAPAPFRRWMRPPNGGESLWEEAYAVPTDVFDFRNTAERANYFDAVGELHGLPPLDLSEDEYGDDRSMFLSTLDDYGLTDASMQLAAPEKLPARLLKGLTAPNVYQEICLVACRRPADAVLTLDFGVPNDAATPGVVVGVLRSWEERFGVVPERLHPGSTDFQVLAPPTERMQAERLAAEIIGFATDSAAQNGLHLGNRPGRLTAEDMIRSRSWRIWWD